MFRAPADTEDFNSRFYNFRYKQGTAMVCPSDAEIAALKASNFVGSERDFERYVSLLKENDIKLGARVFDFGCSWGYGSYQFANAGYEVHSYEIAVNRRSYGIEKLGVRHVDEPFAIAPGHALYASFDCFFSAHVLEHVPAPSKIIDLAWRCLRPGGIFVAITPNGSNAYRDHHAESWRNMWGGVHPNFLDDVFYEYHFARSQRGYASPNGGDPFEDYELGFVAVKDIAQAGF